MPLRIFMLISIGGLDGKQVCVREIPFRLCDDVIICMDLGMIQKTMRKNDLSWGTYVDPLGTHCNAHPNNLVLLPEVPTSPPQ